MANNPYVNKVKLADGTTILDISDTTATTNDVLAGQVFYGATGARSVGSIDLSEKADKVDNATSGNFAALDSTGNLIDSGHKHSDYLTQHQDVSDKVDITQTLEAYTDLNMVVTSGFYRLSTNHVNAPNGADYSQMIVSKGSDTIFQTIGIWGTGKIYARTGNNLGTASPSFTNWVELTNKVGKSETDQWVNSGTGVTGIGIANNQNGHYVSFIADSEGGNVVISKSGKRAEFDTYGIASDGSGYARIVVDNADSYKAFKLQQDGNFVDGNNVSTGGLNRDKVATSAYAIVETTNTATNNITSGQYVYWNGGLYKAKSNISSGATLSSSNLGSVSNGGMNVLSTAIKAISDVIGASVICNEIVSNLNTVPEYMGGIKFFRFENTSTNKPKSYGGAGLNISSFSYGVQIVFTHSSTASTLSFRSYSGMSSGGTATFSAWKDIAST